MKAGVRGRWARPGKSGEADKLGNFAGAFIVAACCLLLISCAAPKAEKPVADERYHSVLNKWTRQDKVYEEFEATLFIIGTFKSEEYRESYVGEYSRVYLLDGGKVRKLMDDEIEMSKRYNEIFLSIYTIVREWNNLETREPMWALYLVNDAGDKVPAVEIKRIKQRGPAVTLFYPYHGDWNVGYTIKFPVSLPDGRQFITAETKYVKFIMTGPPGKGELKWELKQ